jgi:hypothetical protein
MIDSSQKLHPTILTFRLFLENCLDLIEGTLGLSYRVHPVDIIPVESFIEYNDRDVADAAEVHEVFDGEWKPDFKSMPKNYIMN